MNDTPSLSPNRPKQAVIILVFLGILAGGGFLGYQKFMAWHEQQVSDALSTQKTEFMEKETALLYETQQLQEALAKRTPPEASPEKLTDVFGTPETGAPEKIEDTCDTIRERLLHFFKYLETADAGEESRRLMDFPGGPARILFKLSSNLPMITDETKDMVSLKHNEAHFYRVLGTDNVNEVLAVLAADDEVLESALADFYRYYVEKDCCVAESGAPCVSIDTLYTYAGFFLETLAGKSYLFRRTARLRCLAEYYAVRVLDRASDDGINPYGIDIRPHIERALDSLQNQSRLVFQESYAEILLGLKAKYAPESDPGDQPE